MALVASDLINAARVRTFGVQGREKISNAALLGELSAQDMILVQEVSQMVPNLLASTAGMASVTFTENVYGYNLDEGMHYRDFTHVANGVYTPISVVSRQYQEENVRHPAVMINSDGAGAVLYPIDPRGKRWSESGPRTWFDQDAGHEIHYSYVRMPGEMTSLSDELVSPEMAREVLVSALMLAIVLHNREASEIQVQAAVQRYASARTTFMWQAHKFAAPQGERPASRGSRSDRAWVEDNIG